MTIDNAKRTLLDDLITKAKKQGADAADAVCIDGDSMSVSWRSGQIETLERAEGADLGLRVLIGKQQASCSTSDLSTKSIDEIIERAISMAKAAPEDPYCGIADEADLAKNLHKLDLADDFQIDTPELIELTKEMEEAALSVQNVAQCDSADAGASQTNVYIAASNSFSGAYTRTSYYLCTSVIAGEGTAMESDHDYHGCTHKADLLNATEIAKRAGAKAVKNLGARKMPSCQVPVIFDPDEAAELIGSLAGAINGSSIARGTSFLKDYMGKQIFPEAIKIIDDPYRHRGLRSRLFDAEGILPEKRNIIENGVLQTWLLDLRSARQLGLKSTGHAVRGTSSVPSPSASNFYMEAGNLTPKALIADIQEGFYVTETMGMGVNDITGDYSLAARGFWIEKGQKSFPVHEMTIAGNLKDMFMNMTAANDLVFRHGVDSPTLRIEGMTVAGS